MSKRKILVPEAKQALNQFKNDTMKKMTGLSSPTDNPNDIKFEIAKQQGIPLTKGKNGHLTSEEAGKIGGPLGGNMVSEMVRLAKEQLTKKTDA